jgi:hypothetical protein
MEIKKHVELLGFEAVDMVTGFKGVITSVSFDLYGCIQAILTQKLSSKQKTDVQWYDITRLKIASKKPVMPLPNYNHVYISQGEKGPNLKPIKR